MDASSKSAKSKSGEQWNWPDVLTELKKNLMFNDRQKQYSGKCFIDGVESPDEQTQFNQTDIIHSILDGHHSLVVLPTGSGKSACFQIPAMFSPGVTLVISPLVSLIKDQVDNFLQDRKMNKPYVIGKREIRAIYPGMDGISLREFFDRISDQPTDSKKPLYKLAYVSPERLENPKFRRMLAEYENNERIHISIIVIDEVHCLSQSSLDFRESYLYIPDFIRQRKTNPTICAFTATATKFDIQLIEGILGFRGTKTRPYYRLYEQYKVRNELIIQPAKWCKNYLKSQTLSYYKGKKYRQNTLIDILTQNENIWRKTVIFCSTHGQVEAVYSLLLDYFKNCPATIHKYYAGMTKPQREKSIDSFKTFNRQIMVATTAFGMGVNIPDITLIIHYDIPLTLEGYYQEIGRGARDGKNNCKCYMLCANGYQEKPENGSMIYTKRWINRYSSIRSLQCMTIASRLKLESQQFIVSLIPKRFSYVEEYINRLSKDWKESKKGTDAQKYIIDYMQKEFGIPDCSSTEFIEDLCSVMNEVNELHIGNCSIINVLRWHGNNILSVSEKFKYSEWTRQNPKNDIYHTLIKTDIHFASAFVIIRGIGTDDIIDNSKILPRINDAWYHRKLDAAKEADRLYLVSDSKELIVREVYIFSDGGWICEPEDETRQTALKVPTNVTGLLPRRTSKKWRDFIDRRELDVFPSDISKFAYVKGARTQNVTFRLEGGEKLDYFDLCVADAIYSIQQKDMFARIYTKKIWEILTGDTDIRFSRASSKTKMHIEKSISRLSNLKVIIEDQEKDFQCTGPFLPLRSDQPVKGYLPNNISPLYRYAEVMNGEIIRVPVSMFALHKHQISKMIESLDEKEALKFGLWPLLESVKPITINLHKVKSEQEDKKPLYAYYPMIAKASFYTGKEVNAEDMIRWPYKERHRQLANPSVLSVRLIDSKTEDSSHGDDITIFAVVRPWQPTEENCVLCHYLLHHIAIHRRTRRCEFLRFDTMLDVLRSSLSKETVTIKERFYRKVLTILLHYRNIGYARFAVYIKNFSFEEKTSDAISKQPKRVNMILFNIDYSPSVSFWRSGEKGYIQFNDFKLSAKNQKDLDKRIIKDIKISDLTGIKLLRFKLSDKKSGSSDSIS